MDETSNSLPPKYVESRAELRKSPGAVDKISVNVDKTYSSYITIIRLVKHYVLRSWLSLS